MLTLAFPWALLLLPLPWLIRHWLPAYREQRSALRIPYLPLLLRLTGQTVHEGAAPARPTPAQYIVLIIIWALAVTALARPQWLEPPLVKTLPMRDLLLAVDLSGSMETEDFVDSEGRRTDRLGAVKQVLADFLARREGDRVGLIFFGSAAYVQAPFTDDLEALQLLLEEAQVRMAGPQTMLGDAVGLAMTLFERSEVEQRVLIVLTDGNDTGSLVPPQRAAEIARDRGIVIHAVAVGDPSAAGEAPLDEATLKSMSAISGGGYFHAADRDQLESIYQRLDELNPRQVETLSYRPQRDLFHWPLAVLLLLSMVYHALQLMLRHASERRHETSAQSIDSDAGGTVRG
jgi:Ca-activated chloride channel family protein